MLVLLAIFAGISLVVGVISSVANLALFKSPAQQRLLKSSTARLAFSVLLGVVFGIGTLTCSGVMWWFGLYPASTIFAQLIATVMVVTLGTYSGMMSGVKLFERQKDIVHESTQKP